MRRPILSIFVFFLLNTSFAQITFVETDLSSNFHNAARGTVVSPDGKHVYIAGASSDAIAIYDRNDSDGKLTYKDSVFHALYLDNVYSVAISGDGNQVYAVSRNDDYITVWDRDASTGELTFDTALLNGTNSITNMGAPYQLKISADDKNLYVTATDDEALVVFDRNTSTGAISFKEAHTGVTDMTEPRFMAFSPNGDNIYVTCNTTSALIVFDRNTGTGALTYKESFTDGSGSITKMAFPHGVACSPNGKHVYVGGRGEDALILFDRNTTTGALTFDSEYVNSTNSITSLSDPQDIAIQSDGDEMYVAGGTDDAVVVFSLDTSTGVPTFVEDHEDGVSGVTSGALNNVHNLVIEPDGEQVYFILQGGDGITTFSVDNPPTTVANSATLAVTVLLEGAWNGSSAMNTALEDADLVAASDPYGGINSHTATASVADAASVPDGVVDWVLVELREAGSAAAANDGSKVGSAAGFLMSDGSIKATDGSSDLTIALSGHSGSDFYVVIYHRNHLPIMSANAISESSGTYTIDFTTSAANTYQTTTALTSLTGSKFGMPAGDLDQDGDIDATDLSSWRSNNGVIFSYGGNGAADLNLDGVINAVDRNDFHQKNTSKTRQVPGS